MNTILAALPLTIGVLAVLTFPAAAQERNIAEVEVDQFYQDLFLKESSIINTDDIELEDKQREAIAEEISYHYTENAIIKYKDVMMLETNETLPIFRAKYDRLGYKNLLEQEIKIKNLNAQYDIKHIEYMGQRATVDLDVIYTYEVAANEYDDLTKITADVITKSKCKSQMKIDYDGKLRIANENCNANTLFSNIEIDYPDYVEDQGGSIEAKFGADVIFKR